jgi:ferredoxin
MSVLITLLALCMLAAVLFTFWGVVWGVSFRSAVKPPLTPVQTAKTSLQLQGHGDVPLEPGVLLNSLWEHLPQADCQSGECGGCKLKLLQGQVQWIREPQAQVDRSCEILACSCEPVAGQAIVCEAVKA